MRVCKVDECDGKHDARGYCSKHYRKARGNGEFEVKRCSVDGCDEQHDSHGYCQNHRRQFVSHGEIKNSSRKRTTKNEITVKDGIATMFLYDTYGNKKAETIFDAEDVDRVCKYKWHIKENDGYVSTRIKGKAIKLHQFIMESSSSDLVDHKNRDKTNNRRSNLRFATKAQNAWNSKIRYDNSSGVRGVSWCTRISKWSASITVNKKQIFLGNFSSIEDAKTKRLDAEKEYYGQFACN